MADRDCLVIVLAAGVGSRMKSRQAKVLHKIAGRTLLAHVLGVAVEAGGTRIAVVSGPDQPQVRDETLKVAPGAEIFIQSERRGTAHAVLAAHAALERGLDDILVLFGDTPLVRADTLRRTREAIGKGAAVAVLGFTAADPGEYGRLIVENGDLIAIREHKDATPAEREIRFCNGGLMALRGDVALSLLEAIDDRNEQNEFYLTDAVRIARARGLRAVALETAEAEIQGVNSRAQLAQAEAAMQQRLRTAALEGGATMIAPETVFLSADTVIGRDVVIEPHVVFGPGVVVEDEVVIHAFSHIEGARIGRAVSLGPFARLRPGAVLGERSRIGNFVEIKATTVEAGAKANHLAYLGDTRVGQGANVGAGTITCNYDGFEKHKTDIGAGAFIGSNSSLVAPVRIGERAYVGSGSVITRNVPDDALAVGRSQQANKEGWASRFRTLKSALKKKSGGH